jgi:mono/diheme cytochrome c family protein
VDSLEEAFAEGISVGHPAMPQFAFAPDDVRALVAYLQSIQNERPPPPQE